jgi:hypothetical protein
MSIGKKVGSSILVILLLVGSFFLGQYFSKQVVKDDTKEEETDNKTDVNEEKTEDEVVYKFYTKDDKIYIDKGDGKKIYLMDEPEEASDFIYSDDKLYYYNIYTVKTTEGELEIDGYIIDYYDLKTNKIVKNYAKINYNDLPITESNPNAAFACFDIFEIKDNKIYYSYGFENNGGKSIQGIGYYDVTNKTNDKIIEKTATYKIEYYYSVGISAVLYDDDIYVIFDDGLNDTENRNFVNKSLYKVSLNGKEELLYSGLKSGRGYNAIKNYIEIQNNKLYFGDSELYSYDLKTNKINKELSSYTYIDTPEITNDLIILHPDYTSIVMKKNNKIKKVSIIFENEEDIDIYPYSMVNYNDSNNKIEFIVSKYGESGDKEYKCELSLDDITNDEYIMDDTIPDICNEYSYNEQTYFLILSKVK